MNIIFRYGSVPLNTTHTTYENTHFMDNVRCQGNEESIEECRHERRTGKGYCGPEEGAGVICEEVATEKSVFD